VTFVVRGVEVYDGTGDAPFVADVRVDGDRIADVDRGCALGGGREIDGAGLALAPGFIDVHSHDDLAVLADPAVDYKVAQGVTTDVVGNCGFGAAPYEAGVRMLGSLTAAGDSLPEWDGYRGYLAAIDAARPALNVAALAGHGTLRLAAMGRDARSPSVAELDTMRGFMREAIDAGAVGLSSGLIYEPGRHADTEELIAIAAEMAGTGALYASHIRNEGEWLLESVDEAVTVGRQAGVPVQISHHKATGRDNWGLVRDSLALIDEARASGLDVTADQYPYTAGSTTLAAFVAVARAGEGPIEPDRLRIASSPHHPEWEGQTLAAIAVSLGLDADAAADHILRQERDGAIAILESMDEADVRMVMAHPTTMIGSDGLPAVGGKPHPRLYGTFPRVIGHYARDVGVLSMAEAVHRMTGLPAAKFGLTDRGVVAAGAFADLVLFRADTIVDTATYDDPRRYPLGVVSVWVNGEEVVHDGKLTGARPGHGLRRGPVRS